MTMQSLGPNNTYTVMVRPEPRLRKERPLYVVKKPIEYYLRIIAKREFGVTFDDLATAGRYGHFVRIRQCITFILDTNSTSDKTREIAALFNQDHSTVFHSRKQLLKALGGFDPRLYSYYKIFVEQLKFYNYDVVPDQNKIKEGAARRPR